ncbi:MAG TPA: RDD family protein [Nocardioides sp.]|uniref:RDD family protein n=1 Tax=Nocardioides sp. TaxID=35761 RepID=UPI002ED8F9FF
MSAEPSYAGDDLVTGEAVALDLPPAGIGLRLLSGLVDVVVTVVALVAVGFVLLTAAAPTDEALFGVAITVTLAVATVGVPTACETLTRGRTLGKWALGLRTVRDDAGAISFQQAFVRALVGFVEIYAFSGMPAFFSVLLSPRGKRLGDYAAGTYVVRERTSAELPPPPAMPPALAAWERSADLGRLPTGLALAVRRYLASTADDSPARIAVGRRLADQVARHVHPLPPAGTSPDAFLAAVMAGRRARDAARLAREAELRRRLTGRR